MFADTDAGKEMKKTVEDLYRTFECIQRRSYSGKILIYKEDLTEFGRHCLKRLDESCSYVIIDMCALLPVRKTLIFFVQFIWNFKSK